MITKTDNAWITLEGLRNGLKVERAFAGINALLSEPDELGKSDVTQCVIFYWERELYPNDLVNKVFRKSYKLIDLEYTEGKDGEIEWYQDELLVLTGYINSVGNTYIITPSRETLISLAALPLDVPDGYELRKNNREKKPKII